MCLSCVALPTATAQPASHREVPSQTVTQIDLESLAHPVLANPKQVRERLDLCHTIKQQGPSAHDERQQALYELARLFIWFAEDTGAHAPGEGRRLELSTLESTALRCLERDVGLSLPEGLVFVRLYPNLDSMPNFIRQAFERRPHTQAVTFLSRYVAFLTETDESAPRALRRQRYQQILDHELVHVVVNSHLGRAAGRIPLWFHEGCAIHFSGQPGSQIVSALSDTPVGPRMVTYQWNLTHDYRDYRLAFRFARHRLGRAVFHQEVRQAIEARSVQAFLDRLEVPSFVILHKRAERWQRRRENLFWAGASLLLLSLGWFYWRRLPLIRKPADEVV